MTAAGIGYLQLMVMRDQKLVEKHAREAGLGDIEVEWTRLSGTTTTQDALIANQLDIVAGGLTGLLIIWDKTRNNIGVKGVASLPTAPTAGRSGRIGTTATLAASPSSTCADGRATVHERINRIVAGPGDGAE